MEVNLGANLLWDLLCHTVSIVSLFLLSWAMVPPQKRSSLSLHIATADVFFSFPYYLWLSYLAVGSTLVGWHTVESRWFEVSWFAYHYTLSYVVKMLLHIPIVLLTEPFPQSLLMVVHHALSLGCYSSSLYYMRMTWWGAFDGICEITTIFMNNLYLLRGMEWKDKYPTLTLINGACFWLSYIPFRLVLFPTWLYWYFSDLETYKDIIPWDSLSPLEKYLYPTTNVVLLALSALWFLRITKGFIKLLKPEKVNKQSVVKKRT